MVSAPFQDNDAMAAHLAKGSDPGDDRQVEGATFALKMLGNDSGLSKKVEKEGTDEELEAWSVLPLSPFTKEEVQTPRLSIGADVPFPINCSGHLPSIGKLTRLDRNRLLKFYGRRDLKTYLLQKNKYEIRNKFYVKVEDVKTLAPSQWINDVILNYLWFQLADQYDHGPLGQGTLCLAFLPSHFLGKLVEKNLSKADYLKLMEWSITYLGKDQSPLDYDVIMFLRHDPPSHWICYAMFPKGRQISAFDSIGDNDLFATDIEALWRWLNDDLRVHWKLATPLDSNDWIFTGIRNDQPIQKNSHDCGLYAIHVGFALMLRATLSKITRDRVHNYRQKLILYFLDGKDTPNILLPTYFWHEELMLQSTLFRRECNRLHEWGIPKRLFDVLGDGNCLFYCMLIKLVQSGVLSDNWEQSCPPAVWMRRQIRKGAEALEPDEWLAMTCQNSTEFVTTELDRIYDPTVDYFDETTMEDSDDHHGDTVDCYIFAKLYSMVVVLYIGDPVPSASQTIVMDGITKSTYQKEGIFPNEKPPGPAVLELVRYLTDKEYICKYTKSGRRRRNPKPYVRAGKGTGHYIFVNEHYAVPVSSLGVTTRSHSPQKQKPEEKETNSSKEGGGGEDKQDRNPDESASPPSGDGGAGDDRNDKNDDNKDDKKKDDKQDEEEQQEAEERKKSEDEERKKAEDEAAEAKASSKAEEEDAARDEH